jgi:HAD superfamily hydrolase (TIGR01509 family)
LLEAVIFDMDGVLIDSEREYRRVELGLAEELGIPFSAAEQSKYVGVHQLVMWREVLKKNGLEHRCAREIARAEEDKMFNYYAHEELDTIVPSIELVKRLHEMGIKCGVATSSIEINANTVIKRLGIEKMLSVLVCSCMVKNCKPAPDIYSKCVAELMVNAANCVAIEDSENGCISAKRAGLKVIGYANPMSGKQDLSAADVIVDEMSEVTLNLLREMTSAEK